ncbi:MAG: hypothetical protein IPL30_03725 [Elusimicrobia bacterium]|nr:hypothetical protein [Elusimicrobiota bacterium]
MKTSILKLLSETENLLKKCGQGDHAAWINEKARAIKNDKADPKQLKKHYKEIKNILGGMGSFSDLVLIPKKASGLSSAKAEAKQRELIEKLWGAVKTF